MSIYDVPGVEFVETDTNTILNQVVSVFEEYTGRKLYPGDPLLLVIKAFVVNVVGQSEMFEYIAKQNLVKYAGEGNLENLGALVGVSRLQATSALVTLRFTISQAQNSVVFIPSGTRVMTWNSIYFATTEDVEIKAGDVAGEVIAKCTTAGEVGNGFEPGEINQIVEVFPYYNSVENITTSNGGSDIETLDNLRERIYEAPNAYSTAGPIGPYKYWAKSVSPLIVDVSVTSPSPGVVELIPLLKDGTTPGDELLSEIYDYCSADERRPLTDMVVVNAPNEVIYNINIEYFISRKNAGLVTNIETNIAKAIEEFKVLQRSSLGRDINPSKLIELLMQTGIKRVVVNEPVFTVLEYNEVAICNNTTPISGGLENE